jgi:hypothetical protein
VSKRWILDTDTKGTGAQMVPLEKLNERASGGRSPVIVRERVPAPPKPPEPKLPRRFRVVDVMTRRVLGEDLGTRATVELLEDVRSSVDVSVYVWEPKAGQWQQVSQREKQMLWGFRGRARTGGGGDSSSA